MRGPSVGMPIIRIRICLGPFFGAPFMGSSHRDSEVPVKEFAGATLLHAHIYIYIYVYVYVYARVYVNVRVRWNPYARPRRSIVVRTFPPSVRFGVYGCEG